MAIREAITDFRDAVSSALVHTTRITAQISNEDLAFHRSSNPSITPLVEQQKSRFLRIAQDIAKVATLEAEVATPRISDFDSIEDNWKGIVDVFDNLLEKADACLDEYTGAIKRFGSAHQRQSTQQSAERYRAPNIAKPQLLFDKVPNNNEKSPFKPLLRSKPHAIKSLEESLQLIDVQDGSKQYGIALRFLLKNDTSIEKE